MQVGTLTIVGVGLIGGSIGLAAKRRGIAKRVLGVGRHQSTLNLAQDLRQIDAGFLELAPAVAEADIVMFCTPVQMIADQARAAATSCRPECIFTDAGSTKRMIVAALDGILPKQIRFVGGHPLAGSEKRGPEYADANLFQDRLTVLTPTPHTDQTALDRVQQLWKALGARVKLMNPGDHDAALAITSHLPHVVASALAGVLPPELRELTATGFRDTTRIAAGDSELWTGILAQNRTAILDALAQFGKRLADFQSALADERDATLTNLLDQAKKVRDALGS
jgi:prephenate dehydrogenase